MDILPSKNNQLHQFYRTKESSSGIRAWEGGLPITTYLQNHCSKERPMDHQRDLFELRYQQISNTDRIGWSDEESTAESIKKIENIVSTQNLLPGKLLELGCGRGNIALAFANEWQVTGVDFSPTAIEWAREFASQQSKEAEFVVADLSKSWPLEKQSFDLIIDANCLHFFHGEERDHFLSEAFRTLRPTGIFIIATDVNEPEQEHWQLLGYDPATRTMYRNGVAMNYATDVTELLDLVSLHGFHVLASEITKHEGEHIWLTLVKAR